MKLFTNEMKELKRPDEPLFKTPKTIQQTLDIQKVSENGIFQLSSTRYSKTYKFKDINYITSNHEEREDIIEDYCKLLFPLIQIHSDTGPGCHRSDQCPCGMVAACLWELRFRRLVCDV